MKRNHETLAQVGEALFGFHWVTPVAEALSVDPRTMRRWVDGQFAIPDGIWSELATLCRQRGKTLDKLAERLSE